MPVNRLLVEGNLDEQLLAAVCAGSPVVSEGSPKNSLAPRTRDLRRDTKQIVCYVRDRDFDFLPPGDLSQPTVDKSDSGNVLGWRWCRHEIENYLIDPGLIQVALGWDRGSYESELVNAARNLRHYQAARWTVGLARQVLPPAKDFPSKPPECIGVEFRLPVDLTAAGTGRWVHSQAGAFLGNVQTVLDPAKLATDLTNHSARFTDPFLADVTNVLVWCSGKDLLAAMLSWLQATHKLHPSELRNRVRDWVLLNPDQTLVLLPEWKTLRDLLRA